MAERYAELLDDVAAKVARMARCGLPPMEEEAARDFGRRVADMLAEDWGGSSVYIPKNLASRFRRRDALLYREFTGHNVQELAQKYYFEDEGDTQRFCTSWATTEDEVDMLVTDIEKL